MNKQEFMKAVREVTYFLNNEDTEDNPETEFNEAESDEIDDLVSLLENLTEEI